MTGSVKNKNIALVGGAGFIGHNLALALKARARMSVAGGKADAIGTKADIVTRLRLSERSRHLQHGARSVVTAPAWRASAEKPDFLAGTEGRFLCGKVKAPGRRHPPTESACVIDLKG